MSHWIFVPVLLPLLTGIAALLAGERHRRLQRALSLIATTALVPLALGLLMATVDGGYLGYALGNWPAPFGIVLVLDRLAALMLLLTALVALASCAHAVATSADGDGKYFHVLFQWQLFGLNGAFLTGDLFNLFVCFEILLIASYGLLLHGGGSERIRVGFHYVVLNLVGSSLFLFAVGVLYGLTGTLNMADLALKVAQAEPAQAGLLRAAAALLILVFALKAALLPLHFWLPRAYSATSASVAALFAIMTKVGVYAIIRVSTLVFEPLSIAGAAPPLLLPLALATIAVGTLGALASRDLRDLVAYLVLASLGTLLTSVGLGSETGLAAGLVYLVHTTLITAGMFALSDLIIRQRGNGSSDPAAPVAQPLLLGTLFLTGAVAFAGLPPLSGFLAKLMILQSARTAAGAAWVWTVILVSSLFLVFALSRMGSALFWKTDPARQPGGAAALRSVGPALGLLIASPLLIVLAGPVTSFATATAHQLGDPAAYIDHVMSNSFTTPPQTPPQEIPR